MKYESNAAKIEIKEKLVILEICNLDNISNGERIQKNKINTNTNKCKRD